MVKINSVLGPLDTDDLGFTLAHEHVLVSSAGIQQIYPEFIPRDLIIERAIRDLSAARAEGVDTIIDVTTIDLGRDIRMLEEVSRGSGVNIVAATGTWRDIPRVFWEAEPDAIAALYIREIEQGIEGTDIKAGVIKVANDKGGVTPQGAIILRAAARAHKATGVPISTHTWAPERVGLQQAAIFEEEGLDLNRVYVGHSNDTTNHAYLMELLEMGAWIGLDRYPGFASEGTDTPDWRDRTRTAARLFEAGYGHKIMLSHDWSIPTSRPTEEERQRREDRNPEGYLFIHHYVLPMLLELGLTQADVDRIMVDNPRTFFSGG